jgi:hypothetical protein
MDVKVDSNTSKLASNNPMNQSINIGLKINL